MSTTYLIAGGRNHANGFSVAAGVTKYYAPISDIANNVTETSVQLRIKDSYVVSKMTLYIGSNTLSGSCVFTSRKNSGPGNQTMTVTTGVTGEFQDLTHTDILSTGDFFNYQAIADAGSGTIKVTTSSWNLEATNNTSFIVINNAPNNPFGGYTRLYLPIAGYIDDYYGAEAGSKVRFRFSATLANMRIYVSSNADVVGSIWRLRKNGTDGNQVITINGSLTGWFEDTTHTDSITSGDDLNYSLDCPNGSVAYYPTIIMDISSTSRILVNGGQGALTTGATFYEHVEGYFQNGYKITTEAHAQTKCMTAITLSNLGVEVAVNTAISDGEIRTRINSNNGNLIVSLTAGVIGIFEDTTHSDVIDVGDLINYQITPVTGITINCKWVNEIQYSLSESGSTTKSSIYYYDSANSWVEEEVWSSFNFFESINSPRILEFIVPDSNNIIQISGDPSDSGNRYRVGQYIYAEEKQTAGQLKFFFGLVSHVESQFIESGHVIRVTAKDMLNKISSYSLNDSYSMETGLSNVIKRAFQWEIPSITANTQILDVTNFDIIFAYDASAVIYTNETSFACNDTIDDMELISSTDINAVDDCYYFGWEYLFGGLIIDISTATGTPANLTMAYEYFDFITGWTALSNINPAAFKYSPAGENTITWDIPGTWSPTTINGVVKYWVRFRVTSVGAGLGTAPLGKRTWRTNDWFVASYDTIATSSINYLRSKVDATEAFNKLARFDKYNIVAPIDYGFYFFTDNQRANYIGDATTSALLPTKLYYFPRDNYTGFSNVGVNANIYSTFQGLSGLVQSYDAVIDVYTDETTEASNLTLNDMILIQSMVNNTAYLFHLPYKFNRIILDISTVGVKGAGNWTLNYEYWNGSYVALSGVVDNSSEYTVSGNCEISWDMPSDWTTQAGLYTIRFRISNVSTGAGQIFPIGGIVYIKDAGVSGLTVEFRGSFADAIKPMLQDYNFSKYPVELLSEVVTHYSENATEIAEEETASQSAVKTALKKEQETHIYLYEVKTSSVAQQNSTAYISQQGQSNGILRGEFGIPWLPTFKKDSVWYLVRPGHTIKVKNDNFSLDSDMIVTEVFYSEPESMSRIKVLELKKGYSGLEY